MNDEVLLTSTFPLDIRHSLFLVRYSNNPVFSQQIANMELSITTPALLFPAISLLMLAYTNRFLALANLIRNLHDKYKKDPNEKHIVEQIRNLRARIRLIRSMQAFGVLSFLFCVICMYCIFRNWNDAAYIIFAVSILSFVISL